MAGRRRRESVEEVASSRSGGGGGVTISFNQPPPEGRPDASLDGAALALGHGTSPARLLCERAILYTSTMAPRWPSKPNSEFSVPTCDTRRALSRVRAHRENNATG